VECPLGDFFASGWGGYAQISSLPVAVNPSRGFNSFWLMPFRKRLPHHPAEPQRRGGDLVLPDQLRPDGGARRRAYFHAQFRRVNPLPYKSVYTIVERRPGRGQYAGTYLAVGVTNCRWWGEGEIKFYIDGMSSTRPSAEPALRTTSAVRTTGTWMASTSRTPLRLWGCTRWSARRPLQVPTAFCHVPLAHHGPDPLRQDLRVTIQALGWRSGGVYLALQPDIGVGGLLVPEIARCSFPAAA